MSISEQTKPATAFSDSDVGETFAPYRAVSRAAAISLALGVLVALPGIAWQYGAAAAWLRQLVSAWMPETLTLILIAVPPIAMLLGTILLGVFRPRLARRVAIIGVILLLPGCIWTVGMIPAPVLILPLIGSILGSLGLSNIRKYPAELTGKTAAGLGTILGVALFIGGIACHALIYSTEVPDGYERLSFDVLKAGAQMPDYPPPTAQEMDGKQVFIKGYIYPGQQRLGLKEFVLVPDIGTCCFGGSPKQTHMVEVILKKGLTLDYSMTKRRLAGVLRVNPTLQPVADRPGVYYQLMADYAK
ncbi:MAG: DUF3299 domain-containing protein [Pirellulaceae bacterium]|jgi:hypothetical protein|nr:hypothetical protein [Planctomycetaceae bacterium]MDP6469062.1 DUF3299 domain-containing protein [Pirellulaceae bacterium]MDP6554281.1 DUF3299 domain-containing protein [Pirellulaceae bacterium]